MPNFSKTGVGTAKPFKCGQLNHKKLMKKVLTLGISMGLLIFLSSFVIVNANENLPAKTIKKSVLNHKKKFSGIDLGYFKDSSGVLFHAYGDTDFPYYVTDLQKLDFDTWVEVPFGDGEYEIIGGSQYYIDSIWYISGAGSYTGVTLSYPY